MAASDFGSRLREARARHGRTLRDVALNAKVSIAYLSDLERGKLSNPTLDTLQRIATELGVSVDELLGGQVQTTAPATPRRRSDALSALSEHDQFRRAVRDQAKRLGLPVEELTDEWLDALGAIEIAGHAPRDVSDYLFIFEATRRAVDPG